MFLMPLAKIDDRPPTEDAEYGTVAVIIATRNRPDDLRRTLSELAKAHPAPHQILVCVDGCGYGTAEMLHREFPNCITVANQQTHGSVFSRDRLLRLASSEFVLSLDDDSHPADPDVFARIPSLFRQHPNAAVISFAEVQGEPNSLMDGASQGHITRSYANCAAAMRRNVYLRSSGFPSFFFHMYEEPDYAIQCYALGFSVWFEPTVRIRHHVSAAQRNNLARHYLHARNEVWSVLMRCPFPQLIPVLLFRIWRQFRFACGFNVRWVPRQPMWWVAALRGLPQCLRHRSPVPWRVYSHWMNL
jgi:GT2 family glycosyltransferase